VKLEAAPSQLPAIRELADAGVAIMAHLGLRPQAVGVLGGYKAQGRTAAGAREIVELAQAMQAHGAAAILLEAVPPQVAQAVVDAVALPVIGCGAGPACHGHVVVTHDAIGLTPRPPRFVPKLADMSKPLIETFAAYVAQVRSGEYPDESHVYRMVPDERERFEAKQELTQ
jgi:3-methyl-2-oxobutanoate hydroxymethyltransferase